LPRINQLIAFVDDAVPSARLVEQADALGIRLEPLTGHVPVLPVPCVVVGIASHERVLRGLQAPSCGFVEWSLSDGLPLSPSCIEHAALGGHVLSLNTRAAYDLDAANLFTQALAARFPHLDPIIGDIELALAEGVANAIIHGNLGIGSKMRNDLQGFAKFQATLSSRLNDADMTFRRLEISAVPRADSLLEISVMDQGDGYDSTAQMGRSAEIEAKCGRGLGLIRQLAHQVEARNGGRCLVMSFRSPPLLNQR
jgi:anti-sigma regulatory factor (Ser/Thr protein kinase)